MLLMKVIAFSVPYENSTDYRRLKIDEQILLVTNIRRYGTFETIFIPIASPVVAVNLRYRNLDTGLTVSFCNRAYLLVSSNFNLINSKFSGSSIHILASLKSEKSDLNVQDDNRINTS